MKLLILTQKVDKNDPTLGFFHRWIEEFSKHVDSVIVICLYKGAVALPSNVRVLSLGKEEKISRLQYVSRFLAYIWQERKNYDVVFVHMNQVYILLGGWLWKLWGKRVALWYTHKKVSLSLKMAVAISDVVFTASKESFRYSTPKLMVMGHGIDTGIFAPQSHVMSRKLLSTGRVSVTKNIHLMIEALAQIPEATFDIAGEAIPEYLVELKNQVKTLGLESRVHFLSTLVPAEIPGLCANSDLFLNLSDTGSMDKAILEAMASGTRVLTSNEAFRSILKPEALTTKDPQDIAARANALLSHPVDPSLRAYVVENHELSRLIPRILSNLKSHQ